ncbi:MAG: calcium-binding protein [Acidobacteriota bacterium]|nr:calcium-binding protein [Acidobacteriota bacterium]
MPKLDDQDKRISVIFGREIPEVKEKTLEIYLAHLKQHLELPCQLTGIEDFDWEEYYVIGPGDKKEYEGLKKTKPSYSDTFNLISCDEIDEWVGIIANVRRVSDRKKFALPLADLEAVNKKSGNYQLLDDYSVWFVNHR